MRKTENLRSTFTHTSWSAHVTPLACNCIAVRVFFYQMTELNEIYTIFIYFLTPFVSQSAVSKEEGENKDAGVDEKKGKNNFYTINIIYVVLTVTINIGTFLRPFSGKPITLNYLNLRRCPRN